MYQKSLIFILQGENDEGKTIRHVYANKAQLCQLLLLWSAPCI
jgi:hypothetical protein